VTSVPRLMGVHNPQIGSQPVRRREWEWKNPTWKLARSMVDRTGHSASVLKMPTKEKSKLGE